MKKHYVWRIIGLALVILILFSLLGRLSENTLTRQKELISKDFANMISLSIEKVISEDESNLSDLQKNIEKMLSAYPEIKSLSVIEKRKYIATSLTGKINKKISKQHYDSDKKLKNILKKSKGKEIIELWEFSEENTSFNYSYPIIKNKKIVNMISVELIPINFYHSTLDLKFLWLTGFLFIILMIVFDRLFLKYSLYISIVLFIILILFNTSNLFNQLDNNLDGWNSAKPLIIEKLAGNFNILSDSISENSSDVLLPLDSAIKSWRVSFIIFGILMLTFTLIGWMEKFVQTIIDYRLAYTYTFPAMFGVFLLVFFPLTYGIIIGFTNYTLSDMDTGLISYFTNVKNFGFGNFFNILKTIDFTDYQNFYFTLIHTILWTALNLTLHVSIGVGLALLLNDMRLKGRTIFRILLILPWAVPSYITALIWKGLFHRQFGAVNGALNLLGFESISWFAEPLTAFLANLATNVWLGFPFMMVIALGALQSIPGELYEAASIDGSSKWNTFWKVTFPLLRPAMVPAIILGTIWTFNQFNVIYLVSSGGPKGATELLITDAYKLAFEQYRYGYAAAYCIIIFAILIGYGVITSKITKATEGVYE